jgi:cupin fold WbuC family metalloprotein
MQLTQQSPEVFLAVGDILSIGNAEIDILKSGVAKTSAGRVRINLHPNNQDLLHEMFIVIQRGSYIRAHKHPNKSEAFHLVYGRARVIIFNDDGSIKQIVRLAAGCAKTPFYYRMSKSFFHSLIIESEILVIHEITNGPFIVGNTIFASFAPAENDSMAIQQFQNNLNKMIIHMEKQ